MLATLNPQQAIAVLTAEGATGWHAAPNCLAIAKTFKFADFDRAFAFITAVAARATAMDHHPEWSNVYSTVEVQLTTHSAGGVTPLDLDLARAMEIAARSSGVAEP
jgi:4a-hydroxytetrahydrobiopterin dehydratase